MCKQQLQISKTDKHPTVIGTITIDAAGVVVGLEAVQPFLKAYTEAAGMVVPEGDTIQMGVCAITTFILAIKQMAAGNLALGARKTRETPEVRLFAAGVELDRVRVAAGAVGKFIADSGSDVSILLKKI